jgi:sugar transferase (PEP-CTERM system associated)
LFRFFNAHFPSRTVILGLSEACIIALTFVSAAVVRLGATDATVMLNYEGGFLKIVIIAMVFITSMYYFDLYDSSILRNRREVLTRLIQVVGTVCVLLAILYYVYPPLELGRGVLAIGVSLVGMILLLWRRLFLAVNSQPEFAERAVLFGDGPLAVPLIREIESRPELGLRIVSHFLMPSNGVGQAHSDPRSANELLFTAAGIEDLFRIVKIHRVKWILVTLGDRRGKLPIEPLLTLKTLGVRIEDGTDFYEAMTGKVPIESLRLGWLLFSPSFCVSRVFVIYKRVASVLISLLGLLLSLPLVPFIALAVKMTSRGPVFYRQKRVGFNGTVFECYKFRTMCADAEADSGPTWAGDDDPRITPVGRFLRTGRLDEIPQLWNVLRGDMSLVGPRPERPEFVERLSREIPHYNLRHTIRPGVTGWAQIRFKYGSSVEDAKEKLRYDLFYVKNMSPGLDLLVLFETVKVILLGRGAQ